MTYQKLKPSIPLFSITKILVYEQHESLSLFDRSDSELIFFIMTYE